MEKIYNLNKVLFYTEGVFNVFGRFLLISIVSGGIRIGAGTVEMGVGLTALTVLSVYAKVRSKVRTGTEAAQNRRIYNANYTITYIKNGAGNVGRGLAEMIPGSSIPLCCFFACYSEEGYIIEYKDYLPPTLDKDQM